MGGHGDDSQDAIAALQAAVERLGKAHDFRELTAGRQECLRLAAQLRDSHAEGKSNVEKLLSINKVLHQELRRERLRADSSDKSRYRMCFSREKVTVTKEFETLFENSIAGACGIEPSRVAVLRTCQETGEVDFTIQPDAKGSSHAAIEELRSQLADDSSALWNGTLSKFASHIDRFSAILPSPHCLWTPEQKVLQEPSISQKVFEDLHDLEGNPEHRESSDDEVDVRKRPEYWGVRVRELAQFHQTIREELVAYCADHMMRFGANGCVHLCKKGSCKWGDHSGIQHQKLEDKSGASELLPNMHAVVARYVKPQTRDVGKSWALKLHPEGLRITHFITHTWEELFADFVGSLEHALDAEDVVWVCSLALDQNADIGKLLNVELSKSPFALALQRASKQLVVLDRDLKVPRRSWCAYELALATRFSMPAFLWPHPKSNIEKLKAEIKSLDLRSASASSLDDQEKILKDIQENEGYEKLNARYRSLLQLTLNFYSSAMSQVAALSAQIQEAVKGKDSEREAQLLQLRRFELRRLEETHGAEQRCAMLQARCRSLEQELEQMRGFVRSVAKAGVHKHHKHDDKHAEDWMLAETGREQDQLQEPPVVKSSSCCSSVPLFNRM